MRAQFTDAYKYNLNTIVLRIENIPEIINWQSNKQCIICNFLLNIVNAGGLVLLGGVVLPDTMMVKFVWDIFWDKHFIFHRYKQISPNAFPFHNHDMINN